MAYLKHGCDLAHHILRAVALGLGLDEHAFDEHFNKPLAVQRLIRYPPQGDEQTSMGAGSHVDYGAITLLHQSAPGLEIQVDGQWRIVDAPPDALIVNTGFMLEKLTGGVLVATQHRVINRNPADRYSTALFLGIHGAVVWLCQRVLVSHRCTWVTQIRIRLRKSRPLRAVRR